MFLSVAQIVPCFQGPIFHHDKTSLWYNCICWSRSETLSGHKSSAVSHPVIIRLESNQLQYFFLLLDQNYGFRYKEFFCQLHTLHVIFALFNFYFCVFRFCFELGIYFQCASYYKVRVYLV